MFDFPTSEKIMDELRQGEVFEPVKGNESQPGLSYYIESYGCQMNFSDSEIVASILEEEGYSSTRNLELADLILLNTCSIREKAEETIRKRLRTFDKIKDERPGTLIGVLGCMAERLKKQLLEEEQLVDLVVGPDAYRSIPGLLAGVQGGQKGINVLLSREETYADIHPVRLDSNGVTSFISIMRGCDNMCSFCVVPFTRGRERSRDAYSIIAEATSLFNQGYREVTLLGQNVDSYKWKNPENEEFVNFPGLLKRVASIHPDLRIRFSTSHPKDITDEVLMTMSSFENICKYIHLPVQSGNSRILSLMNRTYDRQWYMDRVESIRRILDTLSIMQFAEYSMSYMFAYSERPGTPAAKKLADDIPLSTKKRRLSEIVALQNKISAAHNQKDIGRTFKVLIEGDSKKSPMDFKGRNSQNKVIVFPKSNGYKPGDYVTVEVLQANSATLLGNIINTQA